MGALFPMPRIVFAMAEDGLLFRAFARVNYKTLTPTLATIVSGTLSGIAFPHPLLYSRMINKSNDPARATPGSSV